MLLIGKNGNVLSSSDVYVIELILKLSPLSLVVERKDSKAAEALYQKIKQSLENSQPRLLELHCENVKEKKISVFTNEVLAVQIYEKNTSSLGSKRPGFSFSS